MEILGSAFSFVMTIIAWCLGSLILLGLGVIALLLVIMLIGFVGMILYGILIVVREFIKELTRPLWEGVSKLWRRIKR